MNLIATSNKFLISTGWFRPDYGSNGQKDEEYVVVLVENNGNVHESGSE